VLEAPACKLREQERTEGSEYQKSEDEFDDDDSRAVVALDLADDEREDKERKRVGDHRASGRHSDRAAPSHSVLLDDGVRDEGVRGPEASVEKRRRQPVVEREDE
jgi:hypothetical protein